MRIRSSDDEDEFTVYVPPEERWESRPNVQIEHTNSQWKRKKAEYNYRCAYCGIRECDTKEGYLTRDHVYPVDKGGRDTIGNIVPACATCNKRKRNNFVGSLDKSGRCIPRPYPRTEMTPW